MPWHTLSFKCVTRKSGPQVCAGRGRLVSARALGPDQTNSSSSSSWGAADQHEPGKGLLLGIKRAFQ